VDSVGLANWGHGDSEEDVHSRNCRIGDCTGGM
jgi:hypothetical protein